MRVFRDTFKFAGYSQEEFFFHRLNKELMKKFQEKFGRKGSRPGGTGTDPSETRSDHEPELFAHTAESSSIKKAA